MIITKLYGGLGNQMYQYAAGLSLAKRLSTELFLDLSWFEEVKHQPELTLREYELNQFGIKPKEISLKERVDLRLRPPTILKETFFGYDEEFEKLSGNIILDGYWQSYKYFENYGDDLRRAFQFPKHPKPRNAKIIKKMKDTNSIVLHVRRGDYNTKRGKQFHGLIPLSYYNKAVESICKYVKNPTLFIFSDELEWCKQNLKYDLPMEFIDSNSSNKGVEDMQLMVSCKHYIIANSSFSWWSAWLNPNPNKTVYAPKAWFKGAHHEIKDRIPAGWHIL
jgi:hypothetical protein